MYCVLVPLNDPWSFNVQIFSVFIETCFPPQKINDDDYWSSESSPNQCWLERSAGLTWPLALALAWEQLPCFHRLKNIYILIADRLSFVNRCPLLPSSAATRTCVTPPPPLQRALWLVCWPQWSLCGGWSTENTVHSQSSCLLPPAAPPLYYWSQLPATWSIFIWRWLLIKHDWSQLPVTWSILNWSYCWANIIDPSFLSHDQYSVDRIVDQTLLIVNFF